MERLFSTNTINLDQRKIAYFSMEIGLNAKIPTYSGGLGILAGDTLKSCADQHVPTVAITLVSRKGYFHQRINEEGYQIEDDVSWSLDDFLELQDKIISVYIEGREVKVQAWKYNIKGVKGFHVPIIYLDTDVEGNSDEDRRITDKLYGPGQDYRLKQEIVLGIGGIRMIEALGYSNIQVYHMNEGHSSLLTIELLKRTENHDEPDHSKKFDKALVRKKCVFTTHTPVPAGHDQFDMELVRRLLGDYVPCIDEFCHEDKLNMTLIGLKLSHYINGVAKRHGEVSRDMFPGYSIDSITNGVHSTTWAGPSFKDLFDKQIPGWRCDPYSLRYALRISKADIWETHMLEKRRILDYVNEKYNVGMDKDILTIGFARRATSYKRPNLLFHDMNRLWSIANELGPIQIIFGGKAHPNDGEGKNLIKQIVELSRHSNDRLKIVYIENYDIYKAKLMVAGVDVWLNTPLRPREASGTSGMKASVNGILNFSVLDGWWLEGHVEDVTGWSIGPKKKNEESSNEQDADELYRKLREKIVPRYYDDKDNWIRMMRHTIAFNASFFNTNRMIQQYILNAYFN